VNHGGWTVEVDEEKDRKLLNLIKNYNFQSLGIAENNVAWDQVGIERKTIY